LHYYDHARSSKRLTVPKEPCFHHIHSKKAKCCTMVSTAWEEDMLCLFLH
jgi:hypothetical protein